MSLLEFCDVELGFRRQAVLKGLSLEVAAGEIHVLLGRNGVGKSTLLRLALGVLKPGRGHVRAFGLDPVREARQVRERIGYVPDRPDVPPSMKPLELYRFLEVQTPGWDAREVERLHSELGIPDRPFKTLSRGQAAKAMLVAALGGGPELLLLDEPFGGIDAVAKREFLSTLLAEVTGKQCGVLLVTHDLEVASRLGDRCSVLDGGRIADSAPAAPPGVLERRLAS